MFIVDSAVLQFELLLNFLVLFQVAIGGMSDNMRVSSEEGAFMKMCLFFAGVMVRAKVCSFVGFFLVFLVLD